jgi:hypothetical protein
VPSNQGGGAGVGDDVWHCGADGSSRLGRR